MVRVGKLEMRMQEVTIGREFTVDGRVYQAQIVRTEYGKVPSFARFRTGGKWYRRTNEHQNNLLDPSMPLADPSKISISVPNTQKVELLECVYRGIDQQVTADVTTPVGSQVVG